MHASHERCVLVGDSHVDVAAARAAQMPVFIVRYGYPGMGGHEALQCDAFINSLAELSGIVDTRHAQ
jgi:phosphoglycolate phosphatase